MDLSYRAEYAESSRLSCKGCKLKIAKGKLCLAVMVPGRKFHDKASNWYHLICCVHLLKKVDDIENFLTLRLEDQQAIKEKVEAGTTTKKGKKRDAATAKGLKKFKTEYAKSGRAQCPRCKKKILKDEVKISIGQHGSSYHVKCFANSRKELRFFADGGALPGFDKLKKKDQYELNKELTPIAEEDVPKIKRVKIHEVSTDEDSSENKKIEEQNEIIFNYRNQLQKKLSVKDILYLLHFNAQEIPIELNSILDRLSDIMTFGALERCSVCKNGQLVFNKINYVCHGKCNHVEKNPKRRKFQIPEELIQEHSFLKTYEYVPRTRVVEAVQSTISIKNKDDKTDSKPEREKPPLYGMEFVILGKPPRGEYKIKQQITKLGGKVVTNINDTVMAVISTSEEVQKMSAHMAKALNAGIHVVSEKFIDIAKDYTSCIPDLVLKNTIANCCLNPNAHLLSGPSNI